jgi:hypothetical protein
MGEKTQERFRNSTDVFVEEKRNDTSYTSVKIEKLFVIAVFTAMNL